MHRFFINYLHFSRKERLGALLLTFLCAIVFALPEVANYLYPAKRTDFSRFRPEIESFGRSFQSAESSSGELFTFDPNTASFDDFVQLGLSEKVANIICNYRDKGGRFREPADFQKIWSLPKDDYERLLPYIRVESVENEPFEMETKPAKAELFAFDPNSASEAELLRLGLPERTAKSIVNYRAKGGKFRQKEDLRKIYTLDEQDYARLEPYIVMGAAIVSLESPRPATHAGGHNASAKYVSEKLLDVNSAGVEAWQRLPGIGEKRAQRIVAFREALGGFLSIAQVGEMYGLPDSVFRSIRPMLEIGDGNIRKINLNAVSAEILEAHPYISGKQAKLIVAFRDNHGAFASVDDLEKIAAFSDRKWLEKIKPYLSVN